MESNIYRGKVVAVVNNPYTSILFIYASQISRVRSLGLDHWTAEGTTTILEWGNKRANALWEACLPEGE